MITKLITVAAWIIAIGLAVTFVPTYMGIALCMRAWNSLAEGRR